MSATAVLSNGLNTTEQPNYDAEYERILTLRDDIFAGRHPRLKLSKQASPAPLPIAKTNGVSKPSAVVGAPHTHNGVSTTSSLAASAAKPVIQRTPNSVPVSDFDPVLLTKGPALVREEMSRKRRSIEQSLRDQVAQKKGSMRQKSLQEEALPAFDVTAVLKRVHDIVKPVRFADVKIANRPASSTESFDENDYYSSQVNSWTTTEPDRDASSGRQPSSKGDEAGGVQAMDIDSVDADKQARAPPKPTMNNTLDKHDEVVAQAARIAELEEKLRLATEKNTTSKRARTPLLQEEGQIEEPEYSPPDVQQPPFAYPPQRHVSTLDADREHQKEPAPRRSSRPLPPQSSEYATRNESAPIPVQNDMRIVRNHITSPLAPQPARVSPLAVAKAPPVPQARGPPQNQRTAPQAATLENTGSRRVSPEQPPQPLNPRKRRRGKNSGEQGRNVAPRRKNSPEIRVKEEPKSPQLQTTNLEAWRPPRTEEVRRPVYIDTISPQRRASDNVGSAPRRSNRLAQIHSSEAERPFSPVERRELPRNGQFIEINDEPELRRVATTKQIYMPPTGPEPPRTYRASVQPATRYFPEQPHSPGPRTLQRAPSRHGSIVMAPPQPRIVVDQYGHRFIEAPVPQERQMSIIPMGRSDDHELRYEQRRPTVIRYPSYEVGPDGRRYVQRAPSPTSPRYVQRAASPVSPQYARPANTFDNERYVEEPYVPRLQSVRPVNHYEVPRVASVRPEQERFVRPMPTPYEGSRLQSMQPEQDRMAGIRPMTSQYEMPREQFARVQSVRPEQERIVSLGGRREVVQRQVSVRSEDMYMKPPASIVEERPRYSYVPEAQERRYVGEDVFNDRVIYETAGSGSRRVLQ